MAVMDIEVMLEHRVVVVVISKEEKNIVGSSTRINAKVKIVTGSIDIDIVMDGDTVSTIATKG